MLRNYLLTTLRSLRKNPAFAAINIAGLSLGMAAFIFIFQYISFEQSVDAFHARLPQLYRVLYEETVQGKRQMYTTTPPRVASLAKEKFEEVEDYCRVMTGIGNGVVALDKDRNFREDHVAYAEGNFFSVFTFNTLAGNASAIKEANNAAIAQSIARKYFGSENPLGKVITINNDFGTSQ